MPSTYTSNGGIEKIGLGEKAGAWGTTTNNNFDIIDRLTNGVGAITLSGTTHTLTTSDGSLSDGMFKVLVLGGSPSGTNTITISPNDADKLYFVQNGTSQTATFTQGSGANASVAAGEAAIIFADGAGSGAAVTDLSALFPLKSGVAASFTTVTAGTSILPDTSGGADIGSASAEFGDIYIADDKKIKFGSQQDITMEWDEDGTDSLLISGGDVTIADDNKLFFGTDKDVSIEYDEDGNNAMVIAGDVIFADGSTSVDIKSHDLSANGLKLDGTLVTASAAEINKLDGVTRTTSQINSARDGTVTSVATSSGLTGGTITSSGTISMANSWMANTSAALSSSSSASSFSNSSGYPVFISGRSTSTSSSTYTVSFSGGTAVLDMQDGDSGTYDMFATILPNGASISQTNGNNFTYMAVQIRPG
jgi:hypothetical protein